MRLLKPRRAFASSLENLELRTLMSVGVDPILKLSASQVDSLLTPNEIRVLRANSIAIQNAFRHHFAVPRDTAALNKAMKSAEAFALSKDHAVPGVVPLKTLGWQSSRSRHGRFSRYPGSGGSNNGSGSGLGGTPAPVVPTQVITPKMIRHAYGFDQLGLTGAGQTIAIVDAYDDPNITNDLAVFDQQYNLPPADFTKVVPSTGTPAFSPDWSYEISLDVEWAHAIAPGAKIVLVEARTATYSSLLKAVDTAVSLGANQVSMSWGGGEMPSDIAKNVHYDHPGVTFTASSGDSGAGTLGPESSPYVVAVGGTTLSTDAAGNRKSETAWSGSGGGVSAYQSRPNYQIGFNPSTRRTSPDVSYDADPNTGFEVYNSTGRNWVVVGGTSAGAPQWAGLFALVNEGRSLASKSPIGTGLRFGTNDALYAIVGGNTYTNSGGDFYDVSIGSNGYGAGPGYDVTTGLGSPVANKLVPALIAF